MTQNGPNSDSSVSPSVITRPLAVLGGVTLSAGRRFLGMLGGMFLLLSTTVSNIFQGIFVPGVPLKREALWFQMVRVGVRAIPIVVLIELAIGMILPLQMFPQLDQFGQADQVATINAIAAFRELGPLMTAIVLSVEE